jgi:hypothetical protein
MSIVVCVRVSYMAYGHQSVYSLACNSIGTVVGTGSTDKVGPYAVVGASTSSHQRNCNVTIK